MTKAARIEGYAIISEDGMLADRTGVMPDALKFDADQRFFQRGLDGVDVVVNGRHSNEQQPNSLERRRLVVTRQVASLAPDPSNSRALLWNPGGATFEQALGAIGLENPAVGIVGATHVFALFLGRYDVFYLSHAPGVRLPGGRPVFPDVPDLTPDVVLKEHGLICERLETLDEATGLTVAHWRRALA